MTLHDELLEAGFELISSRPDMARYSRRSNPYLQWWVVVNGDATADVQWEFELGQYLRDKGFHVSVQDELSLLLYPRAESRGPADQAFIAQVIEQTEAQLASVNLVTGG
jgi:hypothetical protein